MWCGSVHLNDAYLYSLSSAVLVSPEGYNFRATCKLHRQFACGIIVTYEHATLGLALESRLDVYVVW